MRGLASASLERYTGLRSRVGDARQQDWGRGRSRVEVGDRIAVDAEIERMAQRIRQWREDAGFTLHELAQRSHVAASTIQKIETLQMVPTVSVLLKIARGLGRRPGELIHEGHDDLDAVLVRAAERHPIGERKRMLVERLSGDLFDPQLEVWRVVHEPGSGSGEPMSYGGEEVLLCEEGELTVTLGDREYVIGPGDSLHFKGTTPHRWKNHGARPVRFLVLGTLPKALRASLHERLAHVRDVARERE